MSKKTEEVTSLEVANRAELLVKARALTNETGGGSTFKFIPTLEVNGKSTEKEVEIDGVKQMVTVDPKKVFMLTEKNSADEFVRTEFAPEFDGVIMKVKYQVQKKYKEGDTTPWYSSYEFTNFTGPITVRAGKEVIYEGSYAQFKIDFEDQYTLYMILYTLVGDIIFKVKLKGQSRGTGWDYFKDIKKAGKTQLETVTHFSMVTNTEKQIHYNILTLEAVGETDLLTTIAMAEDLDKALTFVKAAEAIGGTVVSDIDIKDVPFN